MGCGVHIVLPCEDSTCMQSNCNWQSLRQCEFELSRLKNSRMQDPATANVLVKGTDRTKGQANVK